MRSHKNRCSLWLTPPDYLTLSDDNIHIWSAKIDQPAPRVQQLARTLSEDELVRAQRFHFKQDMERFTVGRGILREILALYLGTEPRQLQFQYSPYGKPYLAERFNEGALRFNLAHSHSLALYAVLRGSEVGIDLEYIHVVPDAEEIAARFFSARENAVLQSLPESQRQEAFFNCWTRKEAYIKAIGNGLNHPLDQFDVSLAPGEPACLLNVMGDPEAASRWSLKDLSPAPGYVAAIVVEGHGWQVQCYRYHET